MFLEARAKGTWGKGETALIEERYQIHMSDTFFPKSAEYLSEEKKWDALESPMF